MKFSDLRELVERLLQAFHDLRSNMNVKVHYSQSHLNYFLENLGAYRKEEGEKFLDDMKVIEKSFRENGISE